MNASNTFKDYSATALQYAIAAAVVNPAVSGELLDEMQEAYKVKLKQENDNDYCAHGRNVYQEGLCHWCEMGE